MMSRVAIAVVLLSQSLFAGTPCEDALKAIVGGDHSWRSAFAHPKADGSFLPSDAQREKAIQTQLEFQQNEQQGKYGGHSDTPPMVVVPTAGTKINFTRPWQEYGNMVAEVTGAKDGFIHATVLLPVSAHTSLQDAYKWSKTDTYSLMYDDGSGKEIPLVENAKSLDLVTTHEVDIPLVAGKTVKLLYYRSGSGGPGGFAGGRVLELKWDPSKVDNTPTNFSEKFWN